MSTEIGTEQSLSFILFRLRMIGNLLACLSVGAVLYEMKAHPGLLIALVLFCFMHPPFAYWLANRSSKPRATEFTSFCFTALVWGVWLVIMQFNLVPSILMIAGIHSESAGGWKLYFKAIGSLIIGVVLGLLLFGFHFQPETSLLVMAWSIPSMIIFPLMLGITNYNLSRRLVRQHRKALELSRTDGLSGLMNRDYFDVSAELEFHRCQRGGKISTLVMLDIDHFKNANDKYGHLAGDKIIQQIAQLFTDEVRDIDIVARYGGEEFCLCLVDTDANTASIVAERIRAKVENTNLGNLELRCTISCGVAEFSPHYRHCEEWLNKADKALYRAKRLGRNRVEVADKPAILSKSVAGACS